MTSLLFRLYCIAAIVFFIPGYMLASIPLSILHDWRAVWSLVVADWRMCRRAWSGAWTALVKGEKA